MPDHIYCTTPITPKKPGELQSAHQVLHTYYTGMDQVAGVKAIEFNGMPSHRDAHRARAILMQAGLRVAHAKGIMLRASQDSRWPADIECLLEMRYGFMRPWGEVVEEMERRHGWSRATTFGRHAVVVSIVNDYLFTPIDMDDEKKALGVLD